MTTIHASIDTRLTEYSERQRTANRSRKVPTARSSPNRHDAQVKRSVEVYRRLRKPGAKLILGDPVGTGKTATALVAARELVARGRVTHVVISTPNRSVSELWETRCRWVFDDARIASGRVRAARGIPIVVSRHTRGVRVVLPTDRSTVLTIVDEAHRGLQFDGRVSETDSSYDRLQRMAGGGRLLLVTASPYQLEVSGLERMLSVADVGQTAQLPRTREYDEALNRLLHLERAARSSEPSTSPDVAAHVCSAVESCHAGYAKAKLELEQYLLSPFPMQRYGLHPIPAPTRTSVAMSDEWAVGYHVARVVPQLLGVGWAPSGSSGVSGAAGDMFHRRLTSSSEAFWSGAAGTRLTEAMGGRGPIHDFVEELRDRLGQSVDHPKVRETVEWVCARFREGRNVAVFTRFHATRDVLHSELADRLGAESVVAPTTVSELSRSRSPLADRFRQSSTEPAVLVLTDRFSESIDLDGGEPCLVHHDLDWNPMRLQQRWGRFVRFSTGFRPIPANDVFVPILDVETDRRLFETVLGRWRKSEALLPLRNGGEDDDHDLLGGHLGRILGERSGQ